MRLVQMAVPATDTNRNITVGVLALKIRSMEPTRNDSGGVPSFFELLGQWNAAAKASDVRTTCQVGRLPASAIVCRVIL